MPVLRFQNFTAAARKRNLIRFGMYATNAVADVEHIDDAASVPVGIVGTQNGTNTTFTISAPISALFRNGLRQSDPADYSVTANVLTWVVPPEADDSINGYSE